jgi:hypothetical protein
MNELIRARACHRDTGAERKGEKERTKVRETRQEMIVMRQKRPRPVILGMAECGPRATKLIKQIVTGAGGGGLDTRPSLSSTCPDGCGTNFVRGRIYLTARERS